jgi:hypothetical protein
MIKQLLLTAALLAPGLAYGQVSAPLNLPVTPAGAEPDAATPGGGGRVHDASAQRRLYFARI